MTSSVHEAHFIFYVKDQPASAAYYREVLAREPILDVPGMTQFRMLPGAILGLMSEGSAVRIFGGSLPSPAEGRGVPRAELYALVEAPHQFHARALANGGREVSPFSERDWGHRAAYSVDPDGHVVAFAEEIETG